MLKKQKCKACGFKFRLEKENRYLVKKPATLIGNPPVKPTIFEMFDCPQCGCQNVVGIYEQPIEGEIEHRKKEKEERNNAVHGW